MVRTPGAVDRIARLPDPAHLAKIVPDLAPETLHALIQRRGLEACGELVAAATPEQLTAVLDIDLWRPTRSGLDERFDEDRFGEWLEMLLEEEAAVAARILASIDANVVIAGLSRYIRVFDLAALVEPPDDDDRAGPEISAMAPTREVAGYLVRARRTDAWDAIIALLAALGEREHDYFQAVMQGCRRMSNSRPEVDGLDDLLTEPEQLLHDLADEREHRRSGQGYATPADARAFLQMAREPRTRRPDGSSMNPLAAAYFRAADAPPASISPPGPHQATAESATGANADAVEVLVALLTDTELPTPRPRALLDGAVAQPSDVTPIHPLMERLRDIDAAAFARRGRELGFLANALIAGCSIQSRAFAPQEASAAAVGICNLGIQQWPAAPDTFLVDHDLIEVFAVGWAFLHQQVSMFVAEHLITTLGDVHCVDAGIQEDLQQLRRELVKQRAAGTPWRARGALEVIATLDVPAWACLHALLDECPVLPAVLTATLERRTGPISATAFDFISTTDQIREVHAFVEQLLDVLLR